MAVQETAGGKVPEKFLHNCNGDMLSKMLMFKVPAEMLMAQLEAVVAEKKQDIVELQRAASMRESMRDVSAAVSDMGLSGAGPMDVDSAGNNADEQWRRDAMALVNLAGDASQFGKGIGTVLPEAGAAFMQSQLHLGLGPVKDRAGRVQPSYTNQFFDTLYFLQVDPNSHLSASGVAPAVATMLKCTGAMGMEKVVEMLENKNKKGEVKGISDTAGRALLAGTISLEMKVAAELVGGWKDRPPPLLHVWVRKPFGLGFDKTTLRDKRGQRDVHDNAVLPRRRRRRRAR